MYFSELQNFFDDAQKARAQQRDKRNGRIEELAEKLLVPILEKNFKRRQLLSNDSAELSMMIAVTHNGDYIYIPVNDGSGETYEYDMKERAKRNDCTLDCTALQMAQAVIQIAPRLHHGFSGLEVGEEVYKKVGKVTHFSFILTFTTSEYERYISTL